MGLSVNDGAIGLQDRISNSIMVLPVERARESSFRFLDVNLFGNHYPTSGRGATNVIPCPIMGNESVARKRRILPETERGREF